MKFVTIHGPISYNNGVITIDDIEIRAYVIHDDEGQPLLEMSVSNAGENTPFLIRKPFGDIQINEAMKKQPVSVYHRDATTITIGSVSLLLLSASETSIMVELHVGDSTVGDVSLSLTEEDQ